VHDAPIHVAAELAKSKFQLATWDDIMDCILARLPPSVLIQAGMGNIIVSYNRDKECLEKCEAPEICPSSWKTRPCRMDKLMKFAYPKAFILYSHQLALGLGALKGSELLEFLAEAKKRDKLVVATACSCHGIFSALKKRIEL